MSQSISRASLPQDFIDSTSIGMRLPTPQPQYFFAKMALGAQFQLAAIDAGMETAQQFISMAGGGVTLPPDLDSLVRCADAYPGVVTFAQDFGKGMGDTLKFRRDLYTGGGYSQAARKMVGNQTISTNGINIQMEEVPLTLFPFSGPYAANGTGTQPYIIPEFDAKYRAAKESLASATTRFLRQDYTKWLDVAIRDLFRETSNITYADPTVVTAVTQFTATTTHQLSLETIMSARKAISDREWARFPNGRYMLLVPTKFNVDMVSDVEYRELSKVHEDGRNLLYGYIGSVQDVDIFEVSTLATYAAGAVVPGDGGTVATGVTLQESLLIGPGSVGMGTALAPETRFADDTNYGTAAKLIWYAMHAFGMLDSRGCQRILSQ